MLMSQSHNSELFFHEKKVFLPIFFSFLFIDGMSEIGFTYVIYNTFLHKCIKHNFEFIFMASEEKLV